VDAVLRAATVYAFLLAVFRIAGRRTFAQMTSFDFVLLLIISEATQNAMIGDDFSITNGFLVIATLVIIDVLLSLWKQRSDRVERWLDGLPMALVRDGRVLHERMARSRVDEHDVLAAARERQGLGSLEEIEHAVLEVSGGISIIPKRAG
jgi:uncharacterized membrane protein YcaP (DUF421 family)